MQKPTYNVTFSRHFLAWPTQTYLCRPDFLQSVYLLLARHV